MAEVTVGELAKSIGAPVERLLKQMHEAGLEHEGAEAKVSDDEKQRLLNFLKSSHEKSASDPKKINLQRKTTTTIKSPKGNARKVHDVEVRKKRTYIKREDENVDSGSSAISDEINNEISLSDYAEVLDKHTLGDQSVEAGSNVESRLSVDNSRLGSDSDEISKSGMSTASVEEPSDQIEIQSGINNVLDDKGLTLERLNFEATGRSHPEIPAKEDKLNRQKLVNALAVNLVSPTNNHHRAIGLLGEWGSGKSTVLDLLKQRLQESNSEQPFIFGEFNAWAYEHTDNIQAGVAQEMINALTGSPDVLQPLYAPTASFFEKLKTILSSDLRKIFAAILNAIPVSSNMSLRWLSERCVLTLRFAYKVHPVELLKILLLLLVAAMPWFSDWFHGLIEFSESASNKSSWIWTGGVVLYTLREFGKLIISPQAKELLTYLRLPSYAEHLGTIPVMRKHICTLCNLRLKQKNGKTPRLLFLVDDLDRCSPSAIVKVLEAVRLVLDLDNVIVIIAIDQHIALAALSEHFKDFSPHHKLKNSHAIAREYLSKVINLPIVLTKPSGDDVRVFMGSFWEEMNKTVEKEINDSNPQLETADTTDVSESSGVSAAGGGRLDEGSITQHASTVGDKVPGTLATDTVDIDDSLHSNAEAELPPMMKPVKALSKDQQESFIHWVNYFELSNSRQLKRLNNSYDLMRSYVPLMDRDVSEFEFADSSVSKVYPMLLTLILMEYLNSLHDLEERNQLWGRLFGESAASLGESVGNKLVSTAFIKAYRSLLAAEGNQSLVANVEAFVLPAMT
ncbi:translation initiation factor IF-2 associated domain-containing protein [Cellvibrio sp. pealriver]|uniref:translation initiation factor IF-2 associated domain-containing protein n=1 Tax=Cellvibrio sp. pealriver TaxID=1622269 RepID=UPI00066FBE64|nr:translation initiation factor IF-2 associated domain-containing protein [Cellvibrio sp. pealriver]